MNKNLILIIVLIVVAGGFFGGMQYQKSQRVVRSGQFGGQFANRNGQNTRPVSGTIISSDDTSVTVKLQDGSTKIVLLSGKTVINKQTTGAKTDLATGARVLVIGNANSDGSVTADSISLNTMFRETNGTSPAR